MATDEYREDEIQALITLAELAYPIDSPNNNSYKSFPDSPAEAQTYFRSFRKDTEAAFISLNRKGLVEPDQDFWKLTPPGKEAAEHIRQARPPIYYWYREYYTAVENSKAFPEYSREVFGENLGQHGFSDINQIRMMIEKTGINANSTVLDIGCGNGKIAEYISDSTGARVTGIDYIPEAIDIARDRTSSKSDRLHFLTGTIENPLADSCELFDVVLSIDSIYFGDCDRILSAWKKLLKPGGMMAVFYLGWGGEDLSVSLATGGLPFTSYDISRENWEHQQLKYDVVSKMKDKFESEGNLFIWENLERESIPDRSPYDPAKTSMRRYLYLVTG